MFAILMMMILAPFDSTNPRHISALVAIWNAACGTYLLTTPRAVEFNTHPATGAVQSGQIALRDDQPVGFVIASALPNDPQTSSPETGWVDALAVEPTAQRSGTGSSLLSWAEAYLRAQGCKRVRLGGSLRPFAPGYPTELGNLTFFKKRGYAERASGEETWDVARDLNNYVSNHPQIAVEVRPALYGDENALLQFFLREFPNRWRFEYQESLRMGGRISDWMVVLTHNEIDGFARLTFEDSLQPYERFFPYQLPRPWGQLGPIGVSTSLRGRGYGGALLDAALCHLRARGVRGCVIDWTNLIGFYSKFGFTPYRRYAMLVKLL
jgi:GNAT superfamily N-acetyltransferase